MVGSGDADGAWWSHFRASSNGCTQVFSVVVNIFMAAASAEQTTIRSYKVILVFVCIPSLPIPRLSTRTHTLSATLRDAQTYAMNSNIVTTTLLVWNDRSKHKFTQMICCPFLLLAAAASAVSTQQRADIIIIRTSATTTAAKTKIQCDRMHPESSICIFRFHSQTNLNVQKYIFLLENDKRNKKKKNWQRKCVSTANFFSVPSPPQMSSTSATDENSLAQT